MEVVSLRKYPTVKYKNVMRMLCASLRVGTVKSLSELLTFMREWMYLTWMPLF